MKELSIEEKAKRYDEALARANEMIKAMTNIGGVAKVDDIQHIFPELKESEGEKIRKILVEAVIQVLQDQYCSNRGVSKEKVVAWLEKQGRQQKFIDAIQIEDKVTRSKSGGLVNFSQLERVAKPADKGEQKKGMHNKLTGFEISLKHIIEEAIECGDTHNLKADADMLLRLVQNPAWSEEDEKEVAVLEAYIRSKDWSERHIDRALGIVDELVNKVKSLRPQNQWRPTGAQLASLEIACDRNDRVGFELIQLLKELKKLRKE